MATRPPRASLDSAEEMGQSAATLAPPGRSDYYDHSRPGWQQPQHAPQPGIAGSYSPNNRVMGGGLYGQQGQNQPQEHHYEYENQQAQQASAASAAALHQQEQRGVAQLQNAAAVTAAAGRGSILQPSTGTATGPGPMNNLAGIGSNVLQGTQADLNKRGPVEFNHAISYVNKIKVSLIPRQDSKIHMLMKFRIASQALQKFTSNFLRFCKHTNASPNPFRMFMPKSHSFSTLLLISSKISSSFFPTLRLQTNSKHKLVDLLWTKLLLLVIFEETRHTQLMAQLSHSSLAVM
jgi:paired amphipathic helix protein Sin3a